eukprot:Gregarina_sp_Poly_1__1119@NODE_1274_length_4520_cov_241_024927_g133_i1_p2_GENE_NODE_1274_length_4520_cov_241_024927_g133_i1NODE_1274_length_4520_cov_241_024927_g133_i1_p2_ORF_typecomplete_len403_score32_14Sugar_tr/PF00083_24/2_7e10DUF4079/PF13301_6/3e02DUF4079/PF13301_6/34_NODE_1274_length_4520_cov_241_024927_g133_i125203728
MFNPAGVNVHDQNQIPPAPRPTPQWPLSGANADSTVPVVTSAGRSGISWALDDVLKLIGCWKWRVLLAGFIPLSLGWNAGLLSLFLIQKEASAPTQQTLSVVLGFQNLLMASLLVGILAFAIVLAVSASRRRPLRGVCVVASLAAVGVAASAQSSAAVCVVCLVLLYLSAVGSVLGSYLYATELVSVSHVPGVVTAILISATLAISVTFQFQFEAFTLPICFPIFGVPPLFSLLLLCLILPDSPVSLLAANREDTCWEALIILEGNEGKLAHKLGVSTTDTLRLEAEDPFCLPADDGGPPPYRPSVCFLLRQHLRSLHRAFWQSFQFRVAAMSTIILFWLHTIGSTLPTSETVTNPLWLLCGRITGFGLACYCRRRTNQSRWSLATAFYYILHSDQLRSFCA